MRILHVISEMGAGGAETLVAEMAGRGTEYGWTSAVASGGGFRADALAAQGVAVFPMPLTLRSRRGVLRAAWAVRRAIARFRPDIVVAHNVGASLVSRLALAPGRRRPLVTVFHGVADDEVAVAARIVRRTSDRVVAVSPATADQLAGAGVRRPVVIRNAVFTRRPHFGRAEVRASLGVTNGTPVALCLARLESQKRHDVLLDAWARLDGDAVLWLAGDGKLRAALEEHHERVGGKVRFLGTREDVPDLLAAADLTVLTSDWEGLPLAVLESMASGRPVVATDVGGVRDVLSGGAGVVVPPGDPQAVAEALRPLLRDRSTRDSLGAEGQRKIQREYDPHTVMKAYDELLRTTLEGKR
ncbi:Glycosyltransferase involved in cell wall bisynthesis [Amycolatopsis lurida]|uniref:glycosyltransferase family 4 protein n=1 Tax=Amycolatopsis lurida TaxID=31959 RepID=UPI000895EFEF|nr:glycosyltransferase family 4 protein [Amycolatopsis lurida]SEE52968.1 Glycosyltransferase involved in cell wall bisynthesis [Amycolatopsis lurida]